MELRRKGREEGGAVSPQQRRQNLEATAIPPSPGSQSQKEKERVREMEESGSEKEAAVGAQRKKGKEKTRDSGSVEEREGMEGGESEEKRADGDKERDDVGRKEVGGAPQVNEKGKDTSSGGSRQYDGMNDSVLASPVRETVKIGPIR